VAQERRNEFLAKVKEIQGDHQLDEKTLHHLVNMFDKGDIKAGVASFGGGSVDHGFNNGLFYGELRAPSSPEAGTSRQGAFEFSFWNKDGDRETYSEASFVACSRARLPLIIQGEYPGSVLGVGLREARSRNITRYGNIGGTIGIGMFNITDEFEQQWTNGRVTDGLLAKMLGNKAWKVDWFEVR